VAAPHNGQIFRGTLRIDPLEVRNSLGGLPRVGLDEGHPWSGVNSKKKKKSL